VGFEGSASLRKKYEHERLTTDNNMGREWELDVPIPGVSFSRNTEKTLGLSVAKAVPDSGCFSMWMTGSASPFTRGIEMGFTAT